VSEHSVNLDIQELARAIQEIRYACDVIERIVQKSLLKEVNVDREYASTDKRS